MKNNSAGSAGASAAVFFLLGAAMYFGVSASESFNLLPKHFSLQGISPVRTGFIMGWTGAGALLVLPFLAAVVDRFRAGRILAVAMLVGMAVPALYFLPVPDSAFFAIPRAVQGALFAVMTISYNAALGRVLPAGSRARGIALFGLIGQAGGLTAAAVGEIMFDSGGLTRLYIFSFCLFALALISALLYPARPPVEKNSRSSWREFIEVLGHRHYILPLFWVFTLGAGFGTFVAFLPDLVLARGIGLVRPFYIAYPIMVALLRLSVSQLFDRYKLVYVLAIPLAVLPLSLLSAYLAGGYTLLALAGAGYGVAHGVIFPRIMGYLMDCSPERFRGRMSLAFNMMFSLGLFVSANLGGFVAEKSVSGVFLAMAGFTSLGFFLLLFFGSSVKDHAGQHQSS